MQKYSKYLAIALGLGFFLIALVAFLNGQPESRDKQLYSQLKPYIPYKIEKKMSGLYILDTQTGKKIEPSNLEVYNVLDNLEKDWGAKHLRIEGDKLIVIDDLNRTVTTIKIPSRKAAEWAHKFYGI